VGPINRWGLNHKGETMAKSKSEEKATNTADVTKEAAPAKKAPDKKVTPEKTSKAGKKSKKAITETQAKEQKAAKKSQAVVDKPKVVQKPRVIWVSKNQKAARALVENDKRYTVNEAIVLLPKLSKVKFDATAEIHISLDIDTKQADQNLRISTALPAGTGKSVKVAVITNEKEAESAKKAGADNTNAEQILIDIAKGKLDFDVLVASPDKMSELGRHAKVLGPKGLMPSPKNGTVTNNPAVIVEEIKRGRVEIKNDPTGIAHIPFGKLSFKSADLEANLRAILNAIKSNKPAGVKGIYVKSIYISSSMSPSLQLDPTEAFKSSKKS